MFDILCYFLCDYLSLQVTSYIIYPHHTHTPTIVSYANSLDPDPNCLTLSQIVCQNINESVKFKNEADDVLRMRIIASGFRRPLMRLYVTYAQNHEGESYNVRSCQVRTFFFFKTSFDISDIYLLRCVELRSDIECASNFNQRAAFKVQHLPYQTNFFQQVKMGGLGNFVLCKIRSPDFELILP